MRACMTWRLDSQKATHGTDDATVQQTKISRRRMWNRGPTKSTEWSAHIHAARRWTMLSIVDDHVRSRRAVAALASRWISFVPIWKFSLFVTWSHFPLFESSSVALASGCFVKRRQPRGWTWWTVPFLQVQLCGIKRSGLLSARKEEGLTSFWSMVAYATLSIVWCCLPFFATLWHFAASASWAL